MGHGRKGRKGAHGGYGKRWYETLRTAIEVILDPLKTSVADVPQAAE